MTGPLRDGEGGISPDALRWRRQASRNVSGPTRTWRSARRVIEARLRSVALGWDRGDDNRRRFVPRRPGRETTRVRAGQELRRRSCAHTQGQPCASCSASVGGAQACPWRRVCAAAAARPERRTRAAIQPRSNCRRAAGEPRLRSLKHDAERQALVAPAFVDTGRFLARPRTIFSLRLCAHAPWRRWVTPATTLSHGGAAVCRC